MNATPRGRGTRLLVVSFYYPPDLSAGSFRAAAIVDALRCQAPPDLSIDVLTTRPNRYRTFVPEAPESESDGRVHVRRFEVPPHRSGMADQSRAFAAFARACRRAVAGARYDVVFATSSRLMTAVLGAVLARRTGARLYLDIRDIFRETVAEVAPALRLFADTGVAALERFAIRRADRVNLVSPGFADYFEPRYPARRFSYLTNGVDAAFVGSPSDDRPQPASGDRGRLRVLYAGNIGEGQGLHAIVPRLAERMRERLDFEIIGDGGRRDALEAAIRDAGADNVVLRDPMDRPRLIEAYRGADVLFIHLNDYKAFRRVLPSKLFEYAAVGKPVWAGVGGYAAEFVRSEIRNAAVFEPCDVDGAIRAFESLSIAPSPRPEFVARYARAALSRALAEDILSLVDAPGPVGELPRRNRSRAG